MIYDWNDLAFGDKTPLRKMQATFIAASREISQRRLKELLKIYLPQGNIVLGAAKEPYILGFEGQPQFKTMPQNNINQIIAKTGSANLPRQVAAISYFQRDLPFLLQKLKFKKVVFINGSWKQAFHTLPTYYVLMKLGLPYDLVSPFTDEQEAKEYENATSLLNLPAAGTYNARQMLDIARQASEHSYDNGFQTGVALGLGKHAQYNLLATAFNKVVPFQTYAWHYGASREANFSPMNDMNHYDTIHAECQLIVEAQKKQINLAGSTLFINLLPCPTCARTLCETDIAKIVYSADHSDGYAIKILEAAGKKITRIVG